MKLFVFAVYLIFASNAFAFTLNGSGNSSMQGWQDSHIKLYVNTANCPAGIDVPTLISESAKVWNNVPTSTLSVSYGGSTNSSTISFPVTVYCEVNFQLVTQADQNSVPGAAIGDGSSGILTRGLLYLNASAGYANIANYDYEQLKIILAHEIGHILGLGHTEDKTALMYFDASAKTQLSLSQDDIDGISYLYPSNELSDNKIAGCGIITHILPPPTPPGKLLSIVILMLMPCLLLARLKRNSRKFS